MFARSVAAGVAPAAHAHLPQAWVSTAPAMPVAGGGGGGGGGPAAGDGAVAGRPGISLGAIAGAPPERPAAAGPAPAPPAAPPPTSDIIRERIAWMQQRMVEVQVRKEEKEAAVAALATVTSMPRGEQLQSLLAKTRMSEADLRQHLEWKAKATLNTCAAARARDAICANATSRWW